MKTKGQGRPLIYWTTIKELGRKEKSRKRKEKALKLSEWNLGYGKQG